MFFQSRLIFHFENIRFGWSIMTEGLRMENLENIEKQKYCLKWNNFQNHFLSQFEALQEEQDFVDVTLSVNGHRIKAHKVVLSACSPYLKNIFKEHPSKHPIVILDNLSIDNLRAVIQFVYTGEVYVQQNDLPSFLEAAEVLQIKGLSESSSERHVVQTKASPSNKIVKKVVNGFKGENNLETKKSLGKKTVSKVFKGLAKEGNEFKEKNNRCNNDVKLVKRHKTSSPVVFSENVPNLQAEDKSSAFSSGDEEYSNELKKHHWLDPRSCPMCNRVYSNLSNLRQHMKLIHNPTIVKCKLCYKNFKTDLYLRRHLISYHEVSINGNNIVPAEKKFLTGRSPLEMNLVPPESNSYKDEFADVEMHEEPE